MSSPFPTIAGLDLPKEYLAQGARTQQIHHALLLQGPAGVGKLALALAYVRTLFAPAPEGPGLFGEDVSPGGLTYDPNRQDAHLIRIGSHPDVIVFARSRELLAEEARELLERLQTSPQRGPCKVAILDQAEQFNPTVANLLLKTLEEPPPWVQFLLLTSSPEQLLPTIRSRTLPVPCRESNPQRVLATFRAWLPDPAMQAITPLSDILGGRTGDLLRFGLLPVWSSWRAQAQHWLSQALAAPQTAFYVLADSLGKLYEQWEAVQGEGSLPIGADLQDLARWLEDAETAPTFVNFHPEEEPPPAAIRQGHFLAVLGRLALAQAHRDPAWQSAQGHNLLEALRRAPRRLSYNANWALVIEALILESFGHEAGGLQPAAAPYNAT